MSRLRVGLLANPAAAYGASHRVGRQVGQLLRLAGVSVVDLSGPTLHVARARALEVRDTLTALVVVGGDGTVSLGAEIVAGTPVRLGIVPAGSGNDAARPLGLRPHDPDGPTRVLLHALSRPAVSVDALEVVSAGDQPHHRSVALGAVNIGFDAQVNARANSYRRGRSTRYTVAVARELVSFRDRPFWIEVDGGEREEIETSLLSVCATGWYGGGMHLVPDAVLDDGTAELVTLTGVGRSTLLRFFPKVFRGTHTTVPGSAPRPAREITVGLGTGEAQRAFADGEASAQLPLTVRVLPQAVRLLVDPDALPLEHQVIPIPEEPAPGSRR